MRDAADLEDGADHLERSAAPVPRTLTMVTTAIANTAAPACQIFAADRRSRRAELDEVMGERGGQSRHRAAADHQELDPAEQERRQGPVSRAEVDIEAAGLGQHRAQLGQCQRARPAEDPADDPDQNDPAHERHVVGHLRRDQEDPRTDHRADDDAERVDRPQDPGQRSRSGVSVGLDDGSFGDAPRSIGPATHRSLCRWSTWFGAFARCLERGGRVG